MENPAKVPDYSRGSGDHLPPHGQANGGNRQEKMAANACRSHESRGVFKVKNMDILTGDDDKVCRASDSMSLEAWHQAGRETITIKVSAQQLKWLARVLCEHQQDLLEGHEQECYHLIMAAMRMDVDLRMKQKKGATNG